MVVVKSEKHGVTDQEPLYLHITVKHRIIQIMLKTLRSRGLLEHFRPRVFNIMLGNIMRCFIVTSGRLKNLPQAGPSLAPRGNQC